MDFAMLLTEVNFWAALGERFKFGKKLPDLS